VRLVVYNNLGQQVKVLVESRQSSGIYTVSWNGRDESGQVVESGLYYFQLNVGNNSTVKKTLFVK
jgi:flagellar hook assembly protein FlgD